MHCAEGEGNALASKLQLHFHNPLLLPLRTHCVFLSMFMTSIKKSGTKHFPVYPISSLRATMLFTHATIVTVNPLREIILDGAILVEGNLIAAIDKTDVLTKMYPAEEIVNLEGHIIIPGLISTHMHTAQTLLRGELWAILMNLCLYSHQVADLRYTRHC
jgi:hypothetical protein